MEEKTLKEKRVDVRYRVNRARQKVHNAEKRLCIARTVLDRSEAAFRLTIADFELAVVAQTELNEQE